MMRITGYFLAILLLLLCGSATAVDSVYVNACGVLNTNFLDCPRVEFATDVYPLVTEIIAVNPGSFHNGDTVRFVGWFYPYMMDLICVSSNPAATHTLTACVCCQGQRGDANCNGVYDEIMDIVSIVDYLFSGTTLYCRDGADVTADGNVDIEDVNLLICRMFNPTCPLTPASCPGGSPAGQGKGVK